ncbi:hypothetical protein DPMN_127439 [Dreissena polymorpha]|uniref:Uncharacterized protein n=1 Tax=Dreissena polymorpha TaxID=45954 RepID=A0A9D4JWH8_DREPO|nr:hypothetical protein DPMN_127439 [Dreissena polymorpha]
MNRCQQSIKSLKYLRGLRLAHPVTDQFDISLLVGAYFYCHIVGDQVVRGYVVRAVSSRIFLSGPLPAHTDSYYYVMT